LQNYKTSKDQIESSLWNWKTEPFWRLFVVFFLCNGSAIKGRDVSPLNAAPHGHYCQPLQRRSISSSIKIRVKATSRGGTRTRESLGPANPQHQDPYHHSLRPEQGEFESTHQKLSSQTQSQKKKKHRGKRTGERVQKSGRQNQKQRKKKQQKRKGITSHRAFIFGVVLHCTAKFPFFAFNKMFEYSVKVI